MAPAQPRGTDEGGGGVLAAPPCVEGLGSWGGGTGRWRARGLSGGLPRRVQMGYPSAVRAAWGGGRRLRGRWLLASLPPILVLLCP